MEGTAWKSEPRIGDRLYANHYGYKAWKLWVPNDLPEKSQADDD